MKVLIQNKLSVGAAALVGVAVILHYLTLAPPTHGAIGFDPSGSVDRNCSGLREASETLVEKTPGIRDGSTLSMLVMGATTQNPQPARRFKEPIPIAPDNVLGRNDADFRQSQDALFGEIEQVCQAAPPGRNSPVYELVKQGVAHLGEMGCGPHGRCFYLVKSDLDEDSQPELRAALRKSVTDPAAAVPTSLVRSIANSGVAIIFCGISEVKPQRTAAPSTEARMRIWTQLFTQPSLVSFERYCGQ